MANTKTEIIGIDELFTAFAKLGTVAIQDLAEPATKSAWIICNKAKQKVGFDDSSEDVHIRDELTVKKPTTAATANAYKVITMVTTGKAYHAIPVELGHRIIRNGAVVGTVKAHPFIRPAADESREEVADIITDAMNTILDNMGGLK